MTTPANNILSTSVPKLKLLGTNWAVFSLRFMTKVEMKGLWGHFDRMCKCPKLPATPSTTSTTTSTTPSATSSLLATEMIDTWEQDKKVTRSLLYQKISDLTLMMIVRCPSVKVMWDTVVQEYMYKGAFSQAHLCHSFMSS
ncbi:hypothetical protein P691DRAFT_688260 [Macrolepiota fuliginosa MF-IS2]|uniref:Uncharacterized protein n=1 Tax=Macrolepiota fuliginosa MF-IS2 TaxID=1400762 RepID=A0A9P5WWS2_9AGAR|nr:hypothetical protein P691DRAFT_688260 [Macrolepiota fuliginosa MF-IS2]